MIDWSKYYNKHSKRQPRDLLIRAISLSFQKENALDLGSGNLIESRFLIQNGFNNVIAVDSALQTKTFLDFPEEKKINLIIEDFHQYQFPVNYFDLVNAQFSLPFHGKKDFKSFFDNIIKSLKPGGIFVGQLFGKKDSWNTLNSNLVFHSKEEIIDLFSQVNILELEEEEKDGSSIK